VPHLQQAQQLQAFVNEVFEVSKDAWAAQNRAKDKGHTELTETEFLALDILAQTEHPLTVGEIQRQIGVLPAQMSRVIRSLENKSEKPLVACNINADDKRKIDVELTPIGQQAYQAYRQMKLGSIQKSLECLSEHDLSEFMRILRLIRETVRKRPSQK